MINLAQSCTTLGELNRAHVDTAVAASGIVFTAVGPDFLCAEMPVDHRTVQPYGLLHGGMSMVLAETLGSVASRLVAQAPVAGVEINGSHLRAVREGRVTGVCTPVRIGRRLHVWRIGLFGPDGRASCESRLTVTVLGDGD